MPVNPSIASRRPNDGLVPPRQARTVNTTEAIANRVNVTITDDRCCKIGFVATIDVPHSAAAPATASMARVVVLGRKRCVDGRRNGRDAVMTSTGCPFRRLVAIQRRRSGDSALAHTQLAPRLVASPHAGHTHD